MFRNIITDMGNVMLRFDPEIPLAKFCSCERSRDIIRNELFRGREWILGDLGTIRNEERYDLVKVRVPEEFHGELKTVVDHWDICMQPLDGAVEFYKKMKASGRAIYVLSNACSKFYEYFPKNFDIGFFDGIVVSSDIRKLKPDRDIYEYLLNRYSLDPKDCIFIDDSPANARGAEALGIRGYVFDGDFEKLFKYIESEDQK